MDNTRKRVLKCYLSLNLDFLDEYKSDDDIPIKAMPALEAKVAKVEGATSMLPTWIILIYHFFYFVDVIIFDWSYKDGPFVESWGSFLILWMKYF